MYYYRYLYIGFIIFLSVVGIYCFSSIIAYDDNKQKLKFKKKGKKLKLLLEDPTDIKEIDMMFNKYGVSVPAKQYQIIRYSILAGFISFWFLLAILFHSNTFWGPLGIIFYIVTIPKEKIGTIKSPLTHILNFYSKSYQKKRDLELYNIVSQMKNIYITMNGNVGTDYVLKEILNFTKYTKTIFVKFISLWNLNKKELAIAYFTDATNSNIGRDLAHLINKLDGLKETEILEQLTMYQKSVRLAKETHRAKHQEQITAFYFALSTLIVILILLNMLVTIVFTNLMEQFKFIL